MEFISREESPQSLFPHERSGFQGCTWAEAARLRFGPTRHAGIPEPWRIRLPEPARCRQRRLSARLRTADVLVRSRPDAPWDSQINSHVQPARCALRVADPRPV